MYHGFAVASDPDMRHTELYHDGMGGYLADVYSRPRTGCWDMSFRSVRRTATAAKAFKKEMNEALHRGPQSSIPLPREDVNLVRFPPRATTPGGRPRRSIASLSPEHMLRDALASAVGSDALNAHATIPPPPMRRMSSSGSVRPRTSGGDDSGVDRRRSGAATAADRSAEAVRTTPSVIDSRPKSFSDLTIYKHKLLQPPDLRFLRLPPDPTDAVECRPLSPFAGVKDNDHIFSPQGLDDVLREESKGRPQRGPSYFIRLHQDGVPGPGMPAPLIKEQKKWQASEKLAATASSQKFANTPAWALESREKIVAHSKAGHPPTDHTFASRNRVATARLNAMRDRVGAKQQSSEGDALSPVVAHGQPVKGIVRRHRH